MSKRGYEFLNEKEGLDAIGVLAGIVLHIATLKGQSTLLPLLQALASEIARLRKASRLAAVINSVAHHNGSGKAVGPPQRPF